ncbi:hypothetical protein MUK42_10859 [Musa troglodytarum]|uniref:Uncharacterized protein n=1 Tax=Musa troglodytarum TaxID=320322 RepID=A0A9E7KH78_9LILI|nr:hypothetical protein MUK42_10859 [Musa troglodytarum]
MEKPLHSPRGEEAALINAKGITTGRRLLLGRPMEPTLVLESQARRPCPSFHHCAQLYDAALLLPSREARCVGGVALGRGWASDDVFEGRGNANGGEDEGEGERDREGSGIEAALGGVVRIEVPDRPISPMTCPSPSPPPVSAIDRRFTARAGPIAVILVIKLIDAAACAHAAVRWMKQDLQRQQHSGANTKGVGSESTGEQAASGLRPITPSLFQIPTIFLGMHSAEGTACRHSLLLLVVAYLHMLLQLKLFEGIDFLRGVQSLGASMRTVLDIMAARGDYSGFADKVTMAMSKEMRGGCDGPLRKRALKSYNVGEDTDVGGGYWLRQGRSRVNPSVKKIDGGKEQKRTSSSGLRATRALHRKKGRPILDRVVNAARRFGQRFEEHRHSPYRKKVGVLVSCFFLAALTSCNRPMRKTDEGQPTIGGSKLSKEEEAKAVGSRRKREDATTIAVTSKGEEEAVGAQCRGGPRSSKEHHRTLALRAVRVATELQAMATVADRWINCYRVDGSPKGDEGLLSSDSKKEEAFDGYALCEMKGEQCVDGCRFVRSIDGGGDNRGTRGGGGNKREDQERVEEVAGLHRSEKRQMAIDREELRRKGNTATTVA